MARSLGVTQKVSSNSKHTLLCLCGHNVLERIKPNTIENTAVVRSSGWSILLFFAFLGVLFAENKARACESLGFVVNKNVF